MMRKPRIVSSRQDGLLVIRLGGWIGFDDVDFRFSEELVSLIQEHVESGSTHLLVDYSRVRFVYHSSLALGVEPLSNRTVVGSMRVAAFYGRNKDTEDTICDGWLHCFETEDEALAFLRSDVPMRNVDAREVELWDTIGPGVGPERCNLAGCDRLRVQYGIFCRPHHYEMLMGMKLPPRKENEQGQGGEDPPPRG